MKRMDPNPGAKLLATSTKVDEGSNEKIVNIKEPTATKIEIKEITTAVLLLISKCKGPISK